MAQKVLFQTALTEVSTTDVEGLGVVRWDEKGNAYRWVKNKGSTQINVCAPALKIVTSVVADCNKRVISVDGAGTSTASLSVIAGTPVTSLPASGASTGDHGWVQIGGAARVNFAGSDTAAAISQFAVATSALPATQVFDVAVSVTATSAATSYSYRNAVELIATPTTAGAATAQSGTVAIHCLN